MKKNAATFYELTMSLLAAVSVAFAIIDINSGLSVSLSTVDNLILLIFVFDYFIRLILSKDKISFIKSNVLDLIAIIPFNSAFRIFRIAKLAKLARISKITKLGKFSKLSRLFAYSLRFMNKIKSFLNTNGFKYILSITAFLIVIGGIAIHFTEGMSFSDGFWWAFVTTTTVGYGDISPSSNSGRLVAMLLMLVGIGLIGSLTSTITSFFLYHSKPSSVADETVENIKARLDDVTSLTDEDIDNICKILKTLNK